MAYKIEFKDKLHAGVTLTGIALAGYYGYKTKSTLVKTATYVLGAGLLGYFFGSVMSDYFTSPTVKEKKMENQTDDSAKPDGSKPKPMDSKPFDPTKFGYNPNSSNYTKPPVVNVQKANISTEGADMDAQMIKFL